jgi:hypothetical protein
VRCDSQSWCPRCDARNARAKRWVARGGSLSALPSRSTRLHVRTSRNLGCQCQAYSPARYAWIRRTVVAPSPTAAATLLTDRDRTSPAAKTPGTLVSRIGPAVRAGIFEHQTDDLERVLGHSSTRLRAAVTSVLQRPVATGDCQDPKSRSGRGRSSRARTRIDLACPTDPCGANSAFVVSI